MLPAPEASFAQLAQDAFFTTRLGLPVEIRQELHGPHYDPICRMVTPVTFGISL